QIALRKAHCGTSEYAVYEMPANQCHPPTARPGASMHERGLAVDFTVNGSIITSHSSSAWQWLNKNASKYGLYNLASEPWHWSTNGN
ncbi:MAG TPA: M15 family metallopeptidase, partial [Acidimicrobiales bacterium]|nr:M15 family metallopeptidase [Acidimicrobiales bacterium]